MGHFHCLDATSGEVLWKKDLQKEYEIQMPIWGIAASPLIYQNLVIQQVCGAGDACMVAYDKLSGKEIWRALKDRGAYASPILIRQADRVWMFNERGELMITKLSKQGLQILSRSKLIEPTRDQLGQRGGVCWSHPAFAEKSIFARNDKQLVRVSLEASSTQGNQ